MELSRLRSFIVLAERLHFGEAARLLHLSQPALIKQIRQLEDEVGAPLFDRGRHGARLTEVGSLFAEEARRLVQQAEAALELGRRAARGEVGRLAIGFGFSTVTLVPRVISKFRLRHPGVEIELRDMSTPGHTPLQILTWFVRCWRMEVTFEEVRAHLGIETQRQWSDLAIARTTPALFGLFSIVTLVANQATKSQKMPIRTAAWYKKELPAFADAIALVRRCLWSSCHFSTSSQSRDVLKVPRSLLERLTDAVSYAA